MSEPSATVSAKPEAAQPSRPLWVEFLIFFALGFGVMFLYWLMQSKPKETPQANAPAVVHGQPLINIGAKSPDATDPSKTDASSQKTVLPEAPAKTETPKNSAGLVPTNTPDAAPMAPAGSFESRWSQITNRGRF